MIKIFNSIFKFSQFKNVFRSKTFLPASIQKKNQAIIQFTIQNFFDKPFLIQLDSKSKLKDFKKKLQQNNTGLTNIKFISDDRIPISEQTLLECFTSEILYISGDNVNYYIASQTKPIENILIPKSLHNLQYPYHIRRDIELYLQRIGMHSQLKFGTHLLNLKQISINDMQQLVIQSIPDHRNWVGQSTTVSIQDQWEKVYWQVQKFKKQQAKIIQKSKKKAKKFMSLGLVAIFANMNFVGFGTYVFFSWDIIEPMAYFISSFGTILLTNQFFKLNKSFTYQGYFEYLTQFYQQKYEKQDNFNRTDYENLKKQLNTLEARLKDYFYIKM